MGSSKFKIFILSPSPNFSFKMSSTYNSDAIEVLTGLDPVRKRPGMYTDTARPNHLLQEVVVQKDGVQHVAVGYLPLQLCEEVVIEAASGGRNGVLETRHCEVP